MNQLQLPELSKSLPTDFSEEALSEDRSSLVG
jgi:hypothetical protein